MAVEKKPDRPLSDNHRTSSIHVRVTPLELAQIKSDARHLGHYYYSEYVRSVLLRL